ncbi:MAG TPA: hypothetical protein VFN42_12585 [Acetobacteraceae bacterium]|nr:hypothetical protein [Acetobacteraceae bacterium]
MRPNCLVSSVFAATLVALLPGYASQAASPSDGGTMMTQQAPPPAAQSGAAQSQAGDEGGPGFQPGMRGGNGPGVRGGYGPGYGGWQGYGDGPGWMRGDGYGPGWRHGDWPGWMHGYGPGMMYGYGPGMMAGCLPWMGPQFGGGPWGYHRSYHPAALNLSIQDVRNRFERWLQWRHNPHLKLGEVRQTGPDTITADIVTQDNSLVQRFNVDRRSGQMYPADN